jgi:ketosteroid isomerase-like protein
MKRFSIILFSFLFTALVFSQAGYAGIKAPSGRNVVDSAAARKEIISIINTVINASGSFDIKAVADFYTPNALVADEEPPFSWNGPTAGVQWVSTVEKTCKDLKIKRLKGRIGRISVYLQSEESVYVIVPVDYVGEMHDQSFEEDGAFTFVFRLVNGKWLIKSQVWVSRKGM